MKPKKIFELIQVDEYSATPKYLQLSNSILKAVETGEIKEDFMLPSINELSFELEISRDTAEKRLPLSETNRCIGICSRERFFLLKTPVSNKL